ncbi:MAG TPA: hypothetical protein VGL89_10170 [Candidatus Koribacter sp.]|jgi:hypothetical protein
MSKEYDSCNHIKTNGSFCDSPALLGDDYCYFHRADRERQKRVARARTKVFVPPLELPVLEDRETIQVAIGQVLNELLADRLDRRIAGLVLYGLQTAAINVRDANFEVSIYEENTPEEYTEHERISLDQELGESQRAGLRENYPPAAATAKTASHPAETASTSTKSVPEQREIESQIAEPATEKSNKSTKKVSSVPKTTSSSALKATEIANNPSETVASPQQNDTQITPFDELPPDFPFHTLPGGSANPLPAETHELRAESDSSLNAPPRKKPAAYVTDTEFWRVVGARARENAAVAVDEVRAQIEAAEAQLDAEIAESREKKKA